ncbi:MAG: HEPN domain-containing protein [Candidatus Latescibacterota bacterium]
MTEAEQNWIDQAKYDLDAAQVMLNACRYIYVFFLCQQAVEKALKARIVGLTGELPPRIHNLIKLAEIAEVELNFEQTRLYKELSTYYIQTRYPEEIRAMGSILTREFTTEYFQKTEETLQWLFSMLE